MSSSGRPKGLWVGRGVGAVARCSLEAKSGPKVIDLAGFNAQVREGTPREPEPDCVTALPPQPEDRPRRIYGTYDEAYLPFDGFGDPYWAFDDYENAGLAYHPILWTAVEPDHCAPRGGGLRLPRGNEAGIGGTAPWTEGGGLVGS